MRIFTAIRHSVDPQFFYGSLWSGNFYPALRQLGHDVIESEVDLLPASKFMWVAKDFTQEERECRDRITQQIIDEVRHAHREQPIDLFLGYFYNSHFNPQGFGEIHALGIPTVNYFCNSVYQFELVSSIAPAARFSWHTEKRARESYLKAGARPVWIQMAADPAVYRPAALTSRVPAACFVGQRYADRDLWMAALIRAKVPVEIYGLGWAKKEVEARAPSANNEETVYLGRNYSPPDPFLSRLGVIGSNVRGQGLWPGLHRSWAQWKHRNTTRALDSLFWPVAKGQAPLDWPISAVFSQYELVLNFSNVWADGRPGSALIPHVRLRDFEAPISRSCYLTGYGEEIAEFYKLGSEIDTYETCEELVDKARFYLRYPDRAEQVREAGYRRALRDHTWSRRFEQLFREIGLGPGEKG